MRKMTPVVMTEWNSSVRYGVDDGGNSTCAQWTACSPCIDFFESEDDSGCLWCNKPKSGRGDGLCVPRSSAQNSCEIGELQVKRVMCIPCHRAS